MALLTKTCLLPLILFLGLTFIAFPTEAKEKHKPDPNSPWLEAGEELVLRDIFFPAGKSRISYEDKVYLSKLSRWLIINPQSFLEIEGHADQSGNTKKNKELGKWRASVVKNYLVGFGVKPDRLKISNYGSTNPLDSRHRRRANRRVSFVLTY